MARPRNQLSLAADSLGRVAPAVSRWVERALLAARPPLTPAQFLALDAIAAESLVASELARRAAVTRAAVSQLVAQLEEGGLIERLPGSGDRRREPLTLSLAGAAALTSARNAVRAGLAQLLGGLPPPEAEALARSLAHVEAALGGRPPPPRPPRPPGPPPHPRPPRRRG
jgi:DNA-binding MarR family transcriptional regulator